jgi:YebC/PmpR family DNA-binding regulatory protein
MAGHSKWAQIKRQKGAADQKRGAVFSKLANAITIAARQGADPAMNFQLRIAIDKARAANMPKDNIQRAVDKATGAGGQAALEEIAFEAYGPGGTAFIIEAATDNRNRTVGEVRAALNKYEGKIAESGAVGYLFKKRGLIVVETPDVEAAELAAIEAGAEDFQSHDGRVFVYTDPKALEAVRKNLAESGIEPSEVSFELTPTVTVPVTDPALAKKVIALSEVLEELDDVVGVASNFDVPEELVE